MQVFAKEYEEKAAYGGSMPLRAAWQAATCTPVVSHCARKPRRVALMTWQQAMCSESRR
jgi:hypothetical protein